VTFIVCYIKTKTCDFGFQVVALNTDTFTLPETLLEVPALPADSMGPSACRKIHFTEYSTEHWFLTNTKASALNDKVKECFTASLNTSKLCYIYNCLNYGVRQQK